MTISDENLIAFMDGELPESDMTRIGKALETTPELVERLEGLRASDDQMRRTFARLDARPMRTDTLNLINTAAAGETVLQFKPATQPGSAANDNNPWMRQAVAAALLLAVGFGGGALISPDGGQGTAGSHSYQTAGIIEQNNPLFSVLENGMSASSVSLDMQGDTSVTPLTSFQTKNKGFCREFSVQSAQINSKNIACRTKETWTVVASVVQNDALSNAAGGFITASQSGNQLLDAMILEWIDGDILDAEDEAKAIAKNWQ